MDYLHYRYKNWKPFEYLSLPEGQKRIARAYMRQEMEDKDELNQQISKIFGGDNMHGKSNQYSDTIY